MRILCFGAVLFATMLPAAETARYTISLQDRTAFVEARFPNVAVESVTVGIDSWAGYDFYPDVEDVAAFDLGGKPLVVESKGEGKWIVPNHHLRFRLTWRVKARKDAMVGNFRGSQFHVTLLKDWALLWGHAFVLAPMEGPLAKIPVEVRVKQNNYGHWDSTLPASGKLSHVTDLIDQLFLAGAFRSYRQSGRKYYFATSQAVVPDAALMSAVDKIFSAQGRYMGSLPSRAPILVFADGRGGSNGGTVVQNSAVFYPDLTQDLKAGNRAALRLIGHELFHLWNGSQVNHKQDAEWSDGKYGWFLEGFTDYYSGATLYREGIFDGPEFSTFLNNLIVNYAQNGEALRATLEDMGSKHWRDRDHQRLPYTKGALIGLLMDLQLRAKGRSLDDYMRAMLRKPNYGMQELLDAWLELAGEAGRNFWNRYIPTAEPLPFKEVFRLAGVSFVERATPLFELGFTLDKTDFEKNARVTGVTPDSAAAKAGVQTGDSLQRFSVYYGDTSKPAKFGLLRNGELVSVEYMPVTTRNVVQVGPNLDVLRSGVQ